MNYNEYTVNMPYKEFEKWQEIQKKYEQLKAEIKNCYNLDMDNNVNIDIEKLKQIGIKLLPMRYQDYNYIEVK